MNINLLILDQSAGEYKRVLQPKFPEVVIHTALNEEGVERFIEKVHVLLTFKISDNLVKKASNLEWIQSMATGVDKILNLSSLKQKVLITSTWGIR